MNTISLSEKIQLYFYICLPETWRHVLFKLIIKAKKKLIIKAQKKNK